MPPQPTSAEDPAPQADVQIAALDPEPKDRTAPGWVLWCWAEGLPARIRPVMARMRATCLMVRFCRMVLWRGSARPRANRWVRKIEDGPAKGYALYDTASGSAAARTFYITGFADGCPRQLTAANVLLGAPSLYEQLHYGRAAKTWPSPRPTQPMKRSKRRSVARARANPAERRSASWTEHVFVSAYDSFGNSNRWTELLVHDGAVLAWR